MLDRDKVKHARDVGFYGVIGDAEGRNAFSDLGCLRVSGPDAAEFLHGQLTNDVKGLAQGQGNLNARVKRTGHLIETFSLHRRAETEFLLLAEREGISRVHSDLDAFLFADDVEMSDVSADYDWLIVQGSGAPEALSSDGSSLEFVNGSILEQGDTLLLARTLTGDPGFVCLSPKSGDGHQHLVGRVESTELEFLQGRELDEFLEILRLDAGVLRVSVDTPNKERLLPETGQEQLLVSYTKGCYLGQEVIARVRTYGSVPQALRCLVFEVEDEESPERVLDSVPGMGESLVIGKKTRGQFLSRYWSPELEAPVVWVYLHRDHRTPGKIVEFEGLDGPLKAKVVLLPLYRPIEQTNRVPELYDRAIRRFADGEVAESVKLLEEVLRIDPTYADAYEAVGVIFGRSGKFHEAIDIFQRLAEVVPDEPMVDTNLSLYFMKIGDKARAEDYSAKALQKNMARAAGSSVTAAAMAASQNEQRKKDAMRKKGMFEQVLGFDPDDPIALYGAGNALSVLEDWSGAADYLDRAVKADKNNAAVYLALGKALEKLEKFTEALEVFRKGMDVASRRGDLMPLNEMEQRVLLLEAMHQ